MKTTPINQKELNEITNGHTTRRPNFETTTINTRAPEEGEPLEEKIARIMDEKSPLSEGAPIIYDTGKSSPEHDIRTDWMEVEQNIATKRIEERRGFFTKREEEKIAKEKAAEEAKNKGQEGVENPS